MDLSYYGNLCAIFYDITKKFAPPAEFNFYTAFMQKDGRVLEAMTGSGRLQIPLMRAGYVVDGVDCSAYMLKRCVERSAQFGLVPNLYQQFLDQMALPHKYQTVVIAVGSFQLITDYQVALQALVKIREHLLPNGDLLFSLFDPFLNAEPWSKRVVRIDNSSIINLTTRRVLDLDQQIADGYCNYELIVDGQVVRQEQELISVVWYNDAQINQLLDQAGFELVKIYDYPIENIDNSRIVHARLK